MIEIDQSVLAYASASYADAAVTAAAQNPSALKRMVDKLESLKNRYGARAARHTAVLAFASATAVAIVKALDNAKVADKVAEVSGKLKAVTGLAILGASLYGLINGLLDMVTPNEDEYQSPSLKQRLDDLAMKNERLDRALQDVHSQIVQRERTKDRDLGKEYKEELQRARREREEENERNQELADEDEEQDGESDDVRVGSTPRAPRGPRLSHSARRHAYASEEVTAFSFLQKQLPGSVTTRDLYPNVHTYRDAENARFLQHIENMSVQQRTAYAHKLAKQPGRAQVFIDHVFAIVRRLRKDDVGQKVHKLGTFVVKWAAIFAVQSIMFKMLVAVTKANVFNAIGGVTRFVMAGLCAVNSVLLLVHTAAPEDQEHGVVQSIKKTANHSKKLLTKMSLRAA